MDLYDKVHAARKYIQKKAKRRPKTAIILGTGLGGLSKDVKNAVRIPYEEIPGFPHSSVDSHAGDFIVGTLEGKNVVVMEGRAHYYEGHSLEEVTFPVRVMRALGAQYLMVSNACGGMNPQYRGGDIMVIEDHINLMGVNPLIGPNDDRLGPRFPDMCEPYSHDLINLVEQVGLEAKIPLQKGVYSAMTGPCLETRAEYRLLRTVGADVIGMSTVPEVIVGVHAGFKIMGLSIVTDECFPDALEPVDIAKIIATANKAEKSLRVLVKGVVKKLR